MKEFGDKLKELRTELGISQSELGKILSTSRTTIHCWEKDKQEPDMRTIKALAIFFDTTTDYLLGMDDMSYENSSANSAYNIGLTPPNKEQKLYINEQLTTEELQIIHNFRKLSTDKQTAIKLLLK